MGPTALNGSASMKRSSGWIHAGMSSPSQTGVTDHMWSMWPWVSRTATGVSLCRAITSRSPSSASCPGSTTMHDSPGAGETT